MSHRLTPEKARLAVDHVGVLVLAREYNAATLVELELKDRFVEAVASGHCTNPHAVAAYIHRLKALEFPRKQGDPTERHKLEALLGPATPPKQHAA